MKQARAERDLLEWLAQISTEHEAQLRKLQTAEAEACHQRELLEWLAQISTEHAAKLRRLRVEEYEAQEAQQRWEQYYQDYSATITEWNEVDHPRQPKGTPDGGQWVGTGGGVAAGSGATVVQSSPSQTTASDRDQTTAQLVALNGAPSSTWPTMGPASSWLPKIGSGVAAGAGVAAGIGAGAFLGGLRNASMGAYWARVPGTQAMPSIWVYELEKRVRAGTLSREDAIGIFNTAVLGAEAQGFKPAGGTMSLVHKSVVDFLTKAEGHYRGLKDSKKSGNIPLSSQPTRQGTYHEWDAAQRRMRETNWWEYKDQDGNDKIIVEHDDGSWHVGTPKPQSKHRTGQGPPKYYE